jgi:PAS domain S-box-containing protein
MLQPPFPADEAKRLLALQQLAILDTSPEERFDRLTRIAQHILDVPIALVSLVDADRQWFKSRQGLDAQQTPREISFCGHAILGTDVFVVEDAATDPRFADNPLVAAAPHIRFYAGAPLALRSGQRVGTLCAIDRQPHQVSSEQLAALRDLADCVSDELERVRQQQDAAEAALNQARYVSIIESSEDAILSKGLDGIITSWNPAAHKLFGYSAQEAIGQPMSILIPLARASEDAQILARIARGEFVEHFETVRIRKDGTPIEVSLRISPIRGSDGTVIGASKILRDISARQQAEAALRKSAQLVKSIVETVVDGIITIDKRGTIQSFNNAAERLFGYSKDEVMGVNVKCLMPEPYAAEHDGYLDHYNETRKPRVIGIGREVVGQRKDGSTFPMDLAVSEMQLPEQTLFVGIVRDITERKRVEQMKIEFVSTVSHELRTPLTSVSGALGLVCGGALGPVSEQAKTMLDIAYKNSQRLTHLINDLLDMEKLAAGKMRFDLETLELMPQVEQAIESLRSYSQQYHVTFALGERAPGIQVRVDASRLQQVLCNLLSNAAKFSPRDGQVDVTVTLHKERVRVAVQDHGAGIPEEFRNRIFQKFSQADSSDTRQKSGTGLGLAISKELIERMNGQIGFESVTGQGACFHFDLPVAAAPSLAQIIVEPNLPGAARLLVVEDDADVASLLTLMLKRAGYNADVAETADLAQQMLAQRPYVAMTLNLLLHEHSGMALMRKLRSQPKFEKLPIIVVSARADDGQLAIHGDFSSVDWLDKPINEGQLIAAVRRSLPELPRHSLRILHVEDDADLHHIVATLGRDVAAFDIATTLAQARKRLEQERYDLVILDIGLPDGSGFSLLPEIRALQPAPLVIVLSGAELSLEQQQTVHQVLVKSRTSTENLLQTIQQSIANTALTPRNPSP